ncbi:Hypothetical predicted protein [Cloeon dipterum]|uniref:C2H2-type domain-containing protein n=1 Tax=Cloeon dipterum TaxID=197152 RepID=A0A8S1DG35_9INSE|nr:Hypothetical predicted protein [Cloeon dipterum]
MKEVKPPIQKPLCRLCECPTSDGHILASQVDRIKLRKWAMEVLNQTEEDENLPEVVEEDALICYFCIWLAELEEDSADDSVAWWPKNLDLNENAKILRESYSAGEVDQCWVQMVEIDLATYGKENPKKRKCGSAVCLNCGSAECLYCGKRYIQLLEHIRLYHKDAIKCGVWGCSTFFHTEEEKERHMQEDFHEKRDKPRINVKTRCKFCEKFAIFSSISAWKHHVTHKHPKLVACMHKGCNEYFKSKSAMLQHVNSLHKRGKNRDILECKQCEYYTTIKCNLKRHEEAKHRPKLFKCDSCDAKFGSERLVSNHYIRNHTLEKCKSCHQDVPLGYNELVLRREEMKLRGKEGKTPIQKPLCRLCECPTSDGHVLASQVDRFKLRKWAMEVMNLTEEDENLPEVVEEDALICYFCIWQAEFGDESGDEAVAWWPKNLDLEENAKVLRENYSVGDVEQCWVQLNEVDLAKNTKKIPKKSKNLSGVCFYCGKIYNSLMHHIKYMHKEAIKCGILGCRTYFHTEKEKEQHMKQDLHEKRSKPSRESRKIPNILCKFCEKGKLYSTVELLRRHMDRQHPEHVACVHYGCIEYFKSKPEMLLHINSFHKRGLNQDLFQCEHCEYFTTNDYNLKRHEEARHKPKIFKCDSCDAKFGSKLIVKMHSNKYHMFDKCKTCGQDVTLGHKAFHRMASICSKCKVSFKCLGYTVFAKFAEKEGRPERSSIGQTVLNLVPVEASW